MGQGAPPQDSEETALGLVGSLESSKEAKACSGLDLIRKQRKSVMDHFNKAYLQGGRARRDKAGIGKETAVRIASRTHLELCALCGTI